MWRSTIGVLVLALLLMSSAHAVDTSCHVVLTDAHGFVYLDIGASQGIRPGMTFDVMQQENVQAQVTIEAVDGRMSRASLVSGERVQPGAIAVLVPGAEPLDIVTTVEPTLATPDESAPVSWLSAASVFSFASAVAGFYATHQASENYAAAANIADVEHYAQQRDRYQRFSWSVLATGAVLTGAHWFLSKKGKEERGEEGSEVMRTDDPAFDAERSTLDAVASSTPFPLNPLPPDYPALSSSQPLSDTPRWTVQSVREQTPVVQIIVDGGYEDGLLVGTLLEIYEQERLSSTDSEAIQEREKFIGKAMVTEASPDWCLADTIGIPVGNFAQGQQVRSKQINTVRYVAASQENLLIDLTTATAQQIKKGDTLQVVRILQLVHPLTGQPLQMHDPVGTIKVIQITPHRFTARAAALQTTRSILAGDLVTVPDSSDLTIHVLRVFENGLYLNRYSEAQAGQHIALVRAASPDNSPIRGWVRAVYPHLVEVESAQATQLQVGETVKIHLAQKEQE